MALLADYRKLVDVSTTPPETFCFSGTAALAYDETTKGTLSMKLLYSKMLLALLSIVFLVTAVQPNLHATPQTSAIAEAQYGDPYSDYRNVRYTNAGLLNERDEVKLGTQLHRQATKKFRLTDVGLDRVERIGQRVARASARPNLLYKFHVIENREINGLSLPGGHIYITTGLLKLANDNELASVLAHEVGHIAARHSLKTLKKRTEYNDFAKSIGELTSVAGDIGRELGVMIGQGVGEGFLLIHSRDEEREADYLGVRGMARAGFDPQGMVTMFQKLQRVEGQTPDLVTSLLSDHPDVQERIDNTRYEITRLRRG